MGKLGPSSHSKSPNFEYKLFRFRVAQFEPIWAAWSMTTGSGAILGGGIAGIASRLTDFDKRNHSPETFEGPEFSGERIGEQGQPQPA
jgi:hypothetical protein